MREEGVLVQLKGHKDVIAAFKDLREYLPKQALRSSVRKAAQIMYDAVEPHVPKFTGRLFSNIIIKTKRTAETIRARLVVRTQGGRKSSTDSFYWRFLEKGWRSRKGVEHKHPFASAAIAAALNAAAQEVVDATENAIDRAEKKAQASGLH
jgi:HK97 gp10 family phage protein